MGGKKRGLWEVRASLGFDASRRERRPPKTQRERATTSEKCEMTRGVDRGEQGWSWVQSLYDWADFIEVGLGGVLVVR